MTRDLGTTLVAFCLTFACGWWAAPREQLDEFVRQTGFLQVDRRRILSATVESLRAQNKLLVYSYKGTVHVRTKRTKLFVLNGDQELIVPAVVTYLVDLSKLTHEFDGEMVTVSLPPLELGDIAFQPERAVMLTGGVLTFSQHQVDGLLRANYTTARRAMTKQAQQEGFVTAARHQAQDNIRTIIQRALPGVSVRFNHLRNIS